MDPRQLKEDELGYELTLRHINGKDERALETLCQSLINEENGVSELPSDYLRLTRSTVARELKECDLKVLEINADVQAALREADDDLIVQGESRLLHIAGRVRGLQTFAPEHAAVQRLEIRIRDLSGQTRVARNSLGAGEGIATGQFEDLDLLVDHQEIGWVAETQNNSGAIPKTTGSAVQAATTVSIQSSVPQSRSLSELNRSVLNPLVPVYTQAAIGVPTSSWTGQGNSASHQVGGVENQPMQSLGSLTDMFRPGSRAPFSDFAPSVRDIFADPAVLESCRRTVPTQPPPPPANQGSPATMNRLSFSQQANYGLAGGHRIHQWALH